MADKTFDILVAGEINPDIILSGDVTPAFGQVEKLIKDFTLTIGSSSVIFACGAARLGLKIGFIGFCGNDIFGQYMLDAMRMRGVDTSHVKRISSGHTGLSVILHRTLDGDRSDRAILTYPGLISALSAEEVPDDLLKLSRHLHVASYFLQTVLQPGLPGLFKRALDLGLTTSLDTNWDPAETWIGVRELLPLTSVFLPNAAEVCALTKLTDVQKAAKFLAELCGIVAVKLGVDGALAVKGSRSVSVPAISMQVIDTVGAGDSFDAGFLYGYLNNWDLEKSLRLGTACGSLSTRAAGGTDAQPDLHEALFYVD
jgi:sugar/nucleoside kinase (ribokinase family)